MSIYKIHNSFNDRTLQALIMAVIVTTALFALMRILVHAEYEYVEPVTRVMPPVIMPKQKKPEIIPDKLDPPEPVEAPPTAMPQMQRMTLAPSTQPLVLAPVTLESRGPSLTALPPGDPIPYLRSQPVYPPRAQSRGISGYVDLVFAINTAGATEDVQVIGAEPKGVFDRAAVRAVRKWKYRPQIADNGEAVRKEGVTTRVRFQIRE